MKIDEQGFFVSLDYHFIGASPDGIVHFECHALRLIEVKCPFTHRGLSIENYSKQKHTCLEIRENSVKLKKEPLLLSSGPVSDGCNRSPSL